MKGRTRVVFVVPTLNVGGAERQVVELANGLDTDRFDVTMFVFGKPLDLLPTVDTTKVRLVVAPRSSRFDLRPVFQLARLMREHRYDVVHCTLQVALAVAYAAARISRTRPAIVDALHTTVPRSAKYALADQLFYRHLMATCEALVTCSDNQKAYWTERRPALGHRMKTVYNGIDLSAFHDGADSEEQTRVRSELGLAPSDVVIGMVAALRPEKNHMGVLEAAGRLVRLRPEAKFVFVGGAVKGCEEVEAQLHRRVSELGLEDHVRWAGKTLTPGRYIAIFDLAVLFSTSTESFPLALLECMAMGKPVVSSAIGGIPEMVSDGKSGLLVPIGDMDAFVSALDRLVGDPGLRARMAGEARAIVEERFSSTAMVRETERILAGAAERQS